MPISWDQLPLEMRQAVVSEMDVGTRVNLSMCSKSENQLVRGTKHGKVKEMIFNSYNFEITVDHKRETKDRQRVLVRPSEDGRSKVYAHHERWPAHNEFEKYSTANDWKETIMNIMSLIGTSVKVEELELETGRNFKETFNWLRNNINLNPKHVSITVNSFTDHYDESIWDWPSHTTIGLTTINCSLPNLEGFNIYDKICLYAYYGNNEEDDNNMTDEELKKFRNAEFVFLDYCNVTINGFIWWFKKWLMRTNDKEASVFSMWFKRGQEISIETVTNALSVFIEGIERRSGGDRDPTEDYWKIDIKKDEKAGGTIKLYSHKLCFEANFNKDIEFKSNIIMA